MSSKKCSHVDVREFDGLRSCLGCGETRFQAPALSAEVATQATEYLYTDLRCLERGRTIRLLVLEPGDYDDPIRCSLILSGLQHAEYEAVSYTWSTEDGDDHKSHSLRIDNSVFHVTRNCDAALRCLRKRQVRKLWLDALCVNQANVKERNHQVGLMDKIYLNAICVHICIKDSLQDHSFCMRWLSAKEGYPEIQRIQTSRFISLFDLRYFGRVWVIQEVALAKRVVLHVNNDSVELSKKVLARLVHFEIFVPPLIIAFLTKDTFQHVADALRISMSSSCSDPRDRVYGTISLLPPHLRTLVPVDYSLQIEQVFAKAVFACIKSSRSLEILHFAHLDDNAPDWTLAPSFTMQELHRYLQGTTCGKTNALSLPFNDGHDFLTSISFDHDESSSKNVGADDIVLPEERRAPQLISGQLLPCLSIRVLLIDISAGSRSFHFGDEGSEFHYKTRSDHERISSRYGPYAAQHRRRIGTAWFEDGVFNQFYTKPGAFHTQYGNGVSATTSLPGDQLHRIEGARPLFLLRNLAPGRFRIVGACHWQQTSSPNNSTWLDIEADAVQNAAVRTQTIEIY